MKGSALVMSEARAPIARTVAHKWFWAIEVFFAGADRRLATVFSINATSIRVRFGLAHCQPGPHAEQNHRKKAVECA
jgi:hypothetical protein